MTATVYASTRKVSPGLIRLGDKIAKLHTPDAPCVGRDRHKMGQAPEPDDHTRDDELGPVDRDWLEQIRRDALRSAGIDPDDPDDLLAAFESCGLWAVANDDVVAKDE